MTNLGENLTDEEVIPALQFSLAQFHPLTIRIDQVDEMIREADVNGDPERDAGSSESTHLK
jgi:hypothetical protein